MDSEDKDFTRSNLPRLLRYYRILMIRKVRRFAPRHFLNLLLIATVMLPMLLLDGCETLSGKTATKETPRVPVLAADAVAKNMPIYISALGTVTPINTVTVKTQISGQLLSVNFKDGQMINAGDVIAEIDPRPYLAQLTQYEGQLAHDKALLANARIDLQRYKTLLSQDSVAQQTLETQIYLVKQYEGTVKADQGQIETIKVNLRYCSITAPVSGRLGIISVDPGNFVQPSDATGIVVLNTMDPIYVDFSIPEDDLPEVANKIATGEKLIAYAQDRSQNKILAMGFLRTTDNQINTTTGTLKLRAQFENEKNILFPNQFVNIQLQVNQLENATVVPTAAVQYGSNGTYVFVLNNDNTVSLKPVTIAATLGNETAITADVTPGQQVIVEGTDKLKDGTAVTVLQQNNHKGNNDSEPV